MSKKHDASATKPIDIPPRPKRYDDYQSVPLHGSKSPIFFHSPDDLEEEQVREKIRKLMEKRYGQDITTEEAGTSPRQLS
ncbi:hypothetical protein BN59_01292 [Legionella massiliensis]|uniref:Uncharacterized protein n=1 Tax=Legionella massiliensis TaxID=1034943 RepID=A0A078KZ71_9GAMM|nr:hypothetical protein [Legionella massiliensis]CDZ77013.1 hypothetical protein BN59_01292 [Legionella massiliensis]CEE12751.1 hypothetical protein BN1094_01292 [Legionella massiliensis]